MSDQNHDWRHYLSVYGSDLSRWPVDVVKSIDVKALQQDDDFIREAALDSALISALEQKPNENFRTTALEHIFELEQDNSWELSLLPASLRQSAIAVSFMTVCLFSGFFLSDTLLNKQSIKNESVMWLGPLAMINIPFVKEEDLS